MTEALFYGDWPKVKKWLADARTDTLSKALKKPMQAVGDAVARRLQQHIQSQDLPWEELAPETVGLKGHGKIYFWKGYYFEGIRHKTTSKGKKVIETQIYLKGDNPEAEESLEQIGFWLEYGTSRIPERALWRPTFKEMFSMKEFKELKKQALDMGFSEAAR
jgi:hypothetical protein